MLQSLEDLCIDSIVKRFYFYNAFFSTEDVGWKRRLEFLRRKYSMELITRLTAREDSIHRYIDFLLNNYIKVLDTTWFRNCSWEKVTAKIAEIGPNIESFFVKMRSHSERRHFPQRFPLWQDLICYLPNLKRFTCRRFGQDIMLKNIAKFCPFIEEIDIKHSNLITGVGAKYLYENGGSPCMKLKKINFLDTQITYDDKKNLLQNLPLLEVFDDGSYISGLICNLHKEDLLSLDKVKPYNLTKLVLTSWKKDDNFLKLYLSLCPRLKSLSCKVFDEDDVTLISNLADLEELDIEDKSDSKIKIDDLIESKGKNLINLTVTKCSLSFSVLAENCVHLEKLKLDEVNIFQDKDSKPALNSLTTLQFRSFGLKNAKVINLLLSSSTQLELISFEMCKLSSEIKMNILKCCDLCPMEKVIFYSLEIEKEYIRNLLSNYDTIRYISIEDCFDEWEDAEELWQFAQDLPNRPKMNIGEYREMSYSDESFYGYSTPENCSSDEYDLSDIEAMMEMDNSDEDEEEMAFIGAVMDWFS